MPIRPLIPLLSLFLALSGCAKTSEATPATDTSTSDAGKQGTSPTDTSLTELAFDSGPLAQLPETTPPGKDDFDFTTDEFTVAAGKEKYLCFTRRLDEALNIDRVSYEKNSVVHHLALVRTLTPEADAPFECNVFFKTTWIPLFANGTDSAKIETPKDASFPLDKGAQLLVQLHLLNYETKDVTTKITIRLHKAGKTTHQAGIYGFGTTNVKLPSKKETSVTNDCKPESDVHIFAAFPHMHTLGTTLTFATGPDEKSLTPRFQVSPWDFDKQAIVPLDLVIKAGELTRVTCTYFNDRDTEVTFGESTENEMCFFTTFVSPWKGLDGCIDLGGWGAVTPGKSTFDKAKCDAITGNDKGVGKACTKKGGECGTLQCTADLDPSNTDGKGMCIVLGCAATSECGTAASCCSPKEAGGIIKTCLPDVCRPDDCAL